MLIDTHAHIDFPQFDTDREDVILNAREQGVEKIVNPGADTASSIRSVELAKKHPGVVFAAIGVHPHDAAEVNDELLGNFKTLLENNKKEIVAIGEIGLDFVEATVSSEVQTDAFEKQLELASEYSLPVIIHTRGAEEQTLEILKRLEVKRGVVHCFTGSLAFSRQVLELGFYISFTGIITFNKTEDLAEVVREVPLDKIMVETDCPYLSPVPNRGKRCESSYVKFVAQKVAEILEISLEEVERITTKNAEQLFGI